MIKNDLCAPIVVAGAAHLDRIGAFHTQPRPGRSVPGTMITQVGGASLNTCQAIVAGGCEVELHTVLGNDPPGELLKQTANARGIPLVAQSGERTASYTAFLDPKGTVTSALADMSAYDSFAPDPVIEAMERLKPHWVFLDANLPADAIEQIADNCKGHLALGTVSDAKAKRILGALERADLLFTNRSEAATLLDHDDDSRMGELGRRLMGRGARTVIITGGYDDVVIGHHGRISGLPVPTIHIRDVVGAGDALTGATLAAVNRGVSLLSAVSIGIAAAQRVLAVDGAWCEDLGETISPMIEARLAD